MDAGQVIREARAAANLSQEDVALALGVSFGAVSQWETGRTHPRRAVALRLDDLLGAGGVVAATLGYTVPMPPPPAAVSLQALKDELERTRKLAHAALELAEQINARWSAALDREERRSAELAERIHLLEQRIVTGGSEMSDRIEAIEPSTPVRAAKVRKARA